VPPRDERRAAALSDPPFLHPAYGSTVLRAPLRPPLRLPYGRTELSGPAAASLLAGRGPADIAADLTRQHAGAPLGERVVIGGTVRDADGRPLPGVLVEIWQANAAGRYAHDLDQHDAPLDANFSGAGWCLTDGDGSYRFVTVKPGAYPWRNHDNAWRPAHVHFSIVGPAFSQRLVTQMYFPGDPLLELDPIFRAIPGATARDSLIARFDLARTVSGWALGYAFDVTLAGRQERGP
jgi:protocatechuate 3,4-dioxygenase beta subunit